MDFQETNGIQTGSGIKLVIYGQEGVGKTSLAAQLPGAVFIDCEGSTSKMDVRRLPKPTSWEMLQQELQFVLESHVQRQYQTVVIDTFDWAERLAIAQLCSKHNVNGIEGFGYGKGWEYEAEEIGRFLDSTERLVRAGIHVALLCHAITRKASLPEVDAEFDHWELKLGNKTTNKIAPLLKEWSDITLFLAFQTHVIATDDKGKKHKATACNRVMYTTKSAWWDAKNRFGLPEMLPLEYASIASLFATPPAPAPVSKAQQLVEQAQAAGLPTEQDFADATPIVIPQQQTTLDGILPQLAQLMEANHVTPEELQQVVGEKGYFPEDMPVRQYPQDFVEGWCIPWWKNIFDLIQQNRNVPF